MEDRGVKDNVLDVTVGDEGGGLLEVVVDGPVDLVKTRGVGGNVCKGFKAAGLLDGVDKGDVKDILRASDEGEPKKVGQV